MIHIYIEGLVVPTKKKWFYCLLSRDFALVCTFYLILHSSCQFLFLNETIKVGYHNQWT